MKSYKPIVIGVAAVIVIAGLYLISLSINTRLANKQSTVNTQTGQSAAQSGSDVPKQGLAPEFTAKVGDKSYAADRRFPFGVFDVKLVAYNSTTGILTAEVYLNNLYPTFEKSPKTTYFKISSGTEIFVMDPISSKLIKKGVAELLAGRMASIIIPDNEDNRAILITDTYSAKSISITVPKS